MSDRKSYIRQLLTEHVEKLAANYVLQSVEREPRRRRRDPGFPEVLQMAKRAAYKMKQRALRMPKARKVRFPGVAQFVKRAADVIPGGLADTKPASAFNPSSLAQGVATEKEHTTIPQVAKEIAKDHLTEDPNYYKKLKLVEKKKKSGKAKPGYTITSKTDPEKTHKLSVTNQGNVRCSCPGFRYRRTCHHVVKMKDALSTGNLETHNIQKIAAAFHDELHKIAERDYKDEYAKFQASRESKVDRAHRNKVRRRLLASGRVEKHDGKDIDHKDGNPRNNGGGNISVTSKSYNRGKH